MVNFGVIYDACEEVGKDPKFSDKWPSDEAWFCGMLNLFCHFKTLGVNRGAMNTIISHNASHLRNLRNNLLQSFPGRFIP